MKKQMQMLIGKVANKINKYREMYVEQKLNQSLGHNEGRITVQCLVSYPEHISIGRNSYVNGGYLCASPNARIIIGNDCLISYNVHIRTDMHCYMDKNQLIREQGSKEKDIVIGDDVWIGFGAQILSGVSVAKGCVIGAGAVVTKSTEEYGVYVGVPARLIRKRK